MKALENVRGSCLFSVLPIFWLFLIRREVGIEEEHRIKSGKLFYATNICSVRMVFYRSKIPSRQRMSVTLTFTFAFWFETAFLIDQNHKPDTDCRWKAFTSNFGIKGSLLTNSSQQSPQFISASLGIHSVNSFLPCVSRNPILLSSLA